MTKLPSPADRYVGQRIRMRRAALGITQEKLADAIGITFQQLQKYEKGVNRITAGRLLEIADFLDVPVVSFYEGWTGAKKKSASKKLLCPTHSTAETLDPAGCRLMRAFDAIADDRLQNLAVTLVEAIAAPPIGEQAG